MNLKPIKPKRISDQVFEQIRELIYKGEFKPGQQILPERELAMSMAVSRTSVRNAINKLVTLGLLEHRQGQGTFVSSPENREGNPLAAVMATDEATLDDLLEVRLGLECNAAMLAAQRATDTDLKAMKKSLDEMAEDLAATDKIGTGPDKIRITLALDDLGIDFIEGGWPGSNPVSVEYFERMQAIELKHAKLAAFGSTRHFRNRPEQDPNLTALLNAKTPVVTIFGKSWDIHVRDALHIELEDNLMLIEDTLTFLRPYVDHLFYDAEHFFDGFKNNEEYALNTLESAANGGAETIILCDTNGGTLPHEIPPIIRRVRKFLAPRSLYNW